MAKEAFSRVHPGYTRYATEEDMQRAWAQIQAKAELEQGLSVADLYLELARALTIIRCDHTAAQISSPMRRERKGTPLYLPFRWRMIEDRAIIETVPEGSPLAFGDEILSIDGRPVTEIVEAVTPFIPVDGYTEWSRANEVSQESFFMGGGVDHFAPLLWDVPAIATLMIETRQGARREVQLARTTFSDWQSMGDPSQRSFRDSVTFERLGTTGAYLRVNSFVNYLDPIKPKKVFDPIFKALKKEGRTRLILDLRKNGGGTDAVQFGLLKNLILEQFRPIKENRAKTLDLDGIRQNLFSWDKSALNPSPIRFSKNPDGTYRLKRLFVSDLRTLKPGKHAFDGDLYVLIGPDNSSGSTNILASLREVGRGVMIGAPTGGSAEGPTAGVLLTLTLPESGLRMTLPFYHVLNNTTKFDHGLGVSPDHKAPMTVAAFRARQDPALAKAKALAGLD
ncbi:MAG: S41 family peptidase [Pseudomonadota bacterium]